MKNLRENKIKLCTFGLNMLGAVDLPPNRTKTKSTSVLGKSYVRTGQNDGLMRTVVLIARFQLFFVSDKRSLGPPHRPRRDLPGNGYTRLNVVVRIRW